MGGGRGENSSMLVAKLLAILERKYKLRWSWFYPVFGKIGKIIRDGQELMSHFPLVFSAR